MSRLVLRFLGSPLVEVDGVTVELRLRKALALLAYLAVGGQRHSRDELAEILFPRQERERGRTDLRQVLSVLRETIGDRLAADRASLWLPTDGGLRVDVYEFHELLRKAQEAGRAGDASADERLASEAVSLVRGEFLAGFFLRDSPAFEQWQETQREALRREHVGALRRLAALSEGRGDRGSAVGWLRRWATLEPLEEGAHRELMRLLALSGERSAALRQYERCRELLKRELDETPSRGTEELRRSIAAGRMETEAIPQCGQKPELSRPPRPGNLPSQPTSFVGREKELAAVVKALRRTDVRLLTLTGPGGTGKTRLALEAASRLADRYEHGAWIVDLAPLRDPGHFAAALAAALGNVFEETAGGRTLSDVVRGYLRGRHLLLVLDNFEHLLPAAPEVAELLAYCPRLKVLATSREPLRIRAEHEVPVPALELPASAPAAGEPARCEAVQFFAQRAAAIMPGFAVDPGNAATVAEICRRLDGLPLAIELAAARVKAFTLPMLLARLEHRLAVLTGGPRDLPVRQQTMRDEIRWSWELLSDGERRLFRRLAVFAGGFRFEDAASVTGQETDPDQPEANEILASLASKSLIRQEEAEGRSRFRMHQVIREYAIEELEQSGETRTTMHRFAAHFLGLAEHAEPHLRGPEQASWFARLEREYDNIRHALAWLLETGAIAEGLRLAGALGWFWFRRARFAEGLAWLESFRTAARPEHPAGARAKVAYSLGWMHRVVGTRWIRNPKAAECYRESLALWRETGDRRGIALSLADLGPNLVSDNRSDRAAGEAAAACIREGIAEARAAGDAWTIGWCLRMAATEEVWPVDSAASSRAAIEEAVGHARATGDPFLRCQTHLGMGEVLRFAQDHAAAEPWLLDALRIAREADDLWSTFDALNAVAGNYLLWGRLDAAKRYYGEALRMAIDRGVKGFTHWIIGGFDWIARKEGRMERAALLRAVAVRGVLGDIDYRDDRNCPGPPLLIDETTDRKRWAVARTMTLEEIVDYAISDRD